MSATGRGAARQAYDFYATPLESVYSFLDNFEGISLSDRILEPSAGNGNIIQGRPAGLPPPDGISGK